MNKKERTLVILTPGFPASEADTTCVPPQQVFVRALKQSNPAINIIVIAFQYPFFSKTFSFYGVQVISLNGRNRGKFYRLWVWLKAWRTLIKINKEKEITGILNFWLSDCAVIGKYFANRNNIKQFTWLLGQDAKKANPYYKLVKPKSSTLIAISDFIADEFFKNYSIRPQYIISVGIDTSMFDIALIERHIDVMGAGSLIPLKRYTLFLEIMKEVKHRFPNVRVVLCGKGPEKERLLQQIKKEELEDNISLLDEVSHPEVIQLMQQSKVFLHTSEYEAYGAVLGEALYAGCYVVSYTRPINKSFQHYYAVKSKAETIEKIRELLSYRNLIHQPVLMHSSTDVAEKMIKLFMD